MSTVLFIVAGYLAVFFPGLGDPTALALTAVGAIWLFTLVNLAGPGWAARFSGVGLVAGLAPILLVGVAVLVAVLMGTGELVFVGVAVLVAVLAGMVVSVVVGQLFGVSVGAIVLVAFGLSVGD